ncbi:hypothetical protein [Gluconobacter japonicus]|uniref:hypothetical protein n=1 Tax=Gluconobacter japonicus TaxID=376620 RepID=UPI000ADB6615|nr:hypothetical protein [Gluconobacter japonicus]
MRKPTFGQRRAVCPPCPADYFDYYSNSEWAHANFKINVWQWYLREALMKRASIQFNPTKLPFRTTLIRQITKQHLTHINDVYWMHANSVEAIKGHFPNISAPRSGPGYRTILQEQERWEKGADDFSIWVRQNTILSAASILEVYIVSACTVVFSACPELIDRSLLGIDSTSFIKHADRLPPGYRRMIKKRSEDPTKGEWSDRIRKLEMEIGRVPSRVSSLVPKLQELQNKRNRIAHSYGAEGELRRTPWEPITAIPADDADILEIFKVVDTVSKELDKYMFGPLIGGYEIMNEYHSWLCAQDQTYTLPIKELVSGFRKYLGKSFGQAPGSNYIQAMIEYYDNVGPP